VIFFDDVLAGTPEGVWEVPEGLHEFLFRDWVLAAHDRGIRLDFHIPQSTQSIADLRAAMRVMLKDMSAKPGFIDNPLDDFHLENESSKWKCMSAMQKGLRRGNFDAAWRPAVALLNGGSTASGMWRRLVITGFEDIGLGDPYALAAISVLHADRKLRDQIGEKYALALALKLLCDAPKSRDLVDAVNYLAIPHTVEAEMTEVLDFSLDQLTERVCDFSLPVKARMMALWRVFGNKFRLTSHELPPGKVSDAIGIFEALDMPPLLQFISYECFRRSGEQIGFTTPFVWQWMLTGDKAWTAADPFETWDDVYLHGVLAAALDKHTWQGKRAIRSFKSGCQPVRQALNRLCFGDHTAALERAVFYTEGALLRPRLYFQTPTGSAADWYHEILAEKMLSNGFRSFEDGLEFYNIVQANLPDLNAKRA